MYKTTKIHPPTLENHFYPDSRLWHLVVEQRWDTNPQPQKSFKNPLKLNVLFTSLVLKYVQLQSLSKHLIIFFKESFKYKSIIISNFN